MGDSWSSSDEEEQTLTGRAPKKDHRPRKEEEQRRRALKKDHRPWKEYRRRSSLHGSPVDSGRVRRRSDGGDICTTWSLSATFMQAERRRVNEATVVSGSCQRIQQLSIDDTARVHNVVYIHMSTAQYVVVYDFTKIHLSYIYSCYYVIEHLNIT